MLVFTKTSGSGQFSAASKLLFGPYDTILPAEQTEIAIGIAAPIEIVGNLSPFSRTMVMIRNTSPGDQMIRFSGGAIAPSFTAPTVGQLLLPGEVLTLDNLSVTLVAIADTLGALVSRFVVRSSGPPIV